MRNSRVDPKLLHYCRWKGGEIGSVAGTPIHPLGEVTLPIKRDAVDEITSRFVIVDCKLPHDILLGPASIEALGFEL